jgi:hypothetical protein
MPDLTNTLNVNAKSGDFIMRIPSTAQRLVYTPQSGELVYDCQQKALYIGDGATAGGNLVTSGSLGTIAPGISFTVTGTLTSAAAATAVTILADSLMPAGMKVYITDWFVSVGGAAAWVDVTATIVKIQDNASTVAITIAKAGLGAKAQLYPGSANITYADLIPNQSGLTASRGIQVVADANFGAGSDLKVTVSGYIK